MKFHILMTIMLMMLNTTTLQAEEKELTGTPIGAEVCLDASGAISSFDQSGIKAFDGDLGTYFQTYDASRTWIGVDLGDTYVISRVEWSTITAGDDVLGLFEGANSPDFMDAVPIYLIDQQGNDHTLHSAEINVSRGFRYVRYVGPHDKHCKLGELKFYGELGTGDDTHFYQLTNIPTLSVKVENDQEPQNKVDDLTANFIFIYDNGTLIQEETGTTRLRGNSSLNFEKKPYRIKFDSKHKVLKGSEDASPAKCKKWTLVNSPDDKTLMRNILGFEVSRRMGMAYTPYCKPVDLIVNGEYRGCYQLCDQVTIDKARVNVPELKPEDITEPELTGGYLVEADALAYNENSWFTSVNDIPITIKSPDEDDITSEQREYIENAFNDMNQRVFSDDYRDAEKGYAPVLDAGSFVLHFLTEQFIANSDTYWSTYFYKDREDNKFYIGPCWDLNLAFDNDYRYYPACNATDFIYRSVDSFAGNIKSFVDRLSHAPEIEKLMHDKWTEARDEGNITAESLVQFIDEMEQELMASQRLNFMRWNICSDNFFAPRYWGTYKAEVQVLRDFVNNQVPWMDDKLKYGQEWVERQTDFTISNAEELLDFAEEVNTGNTMANATLTADIDLDGIDYTPIGSESYPYVGHFDGQGHRIKNLKIDNYGYYQGFIGVLSGGAHIQNIIIDSSCSISGYQYIGGIVAGAKGGGNATIERCGNEADITAHMSSGSANAAGILGVCYGSGVKFTIRNCYNTGHIAGGGECAAISGWIGSDGLVENCYNIGQVDGYDYNRSFCRYGSASIVNCYQLSSIAADSNVSAISDIDISGGYLCYNLNINNSTPEWWQNVDNNQPIDASPVLDSTHGIVYSNVEGYSNQQGEPIKEYFEIASAADLVSYSERVCSGEMVKKGLMTADIDMTGISFTPIGSDNVRFRNEFDGGGHTITNLIINTPDNDFVGLFGVITSGAYIHDVTLGTGCRFSGHSYVAGIAGATRESGIITIERCGNEANVIAAGINAAGILGCVRGSAATVTIRDCYNAGQINGDTENGALCGWIGNSGTIENCYNCAIVNGIEEGLGLFRGTASISNIYDTQTSQGTLVSAQDLASGQICYQLDMDRGIWTQNIDNEEPEDASPVLGTHGIVYPVANIYSNNQGADVNDDGRISIEDIATTIHSLLNERNAGDVNNDGLINLSDVKRLEKTLMKNH